MIVTTGLSLEQAPPIDLPLRHFLTAPLFAIAAAVLLFWQPEAILASRWSPAALAATHLVTVGFLGQVMAGALLQMLPVVAGAPVPAVRPLGTAIHALLIAGAFALATGFLLGQPLAMAGGALFAGLGFGLLAAGALAALVIKHRGASKESDPNRSRWGTLANLTTALFAPTGSFAWALVALLITMGLGVLLSGALLGWIGLPGRLDWVDAHARWGLFGWVGLLILTVSLTVVPLFYVTPAYVRWFARLLAPALFGVIALASFQPLLTDAVPTLERFIPLLLAAGFACFALVTLTLLHRRARPRPDATLLHWWTALGGMLIGVLAWVLSAPPSWLGPWLLITIGVGLPSGMLLKIVPFLCWFHLQSRQLSLGRLSVRVPHMHRLLPERLARLQALGQIATVAILLGLGAAMPLAPTLSSPLARVAAMLLALNQLGLLVLLGGAWRRYRQVDHELA